MADSSGSIVFGVVVGSLVSSASALAQQPATPAPLPPAPAPSVASAAPAPGAAEPAVVPAEPAGGALDPRLSPATARDGHPLAGYNRGRFFLRDRSDNFRLYPAAMLLLDGNAWLGPSVSDADLDPRLEVRAARLGLSGEVLEPVSWALVVAADRQPLANPNGTEQDRAASPGQVPNASSASYDSAQTAGNRASILDAWIGLRHASWLNLLVGQYRVPFTMENSTSLKRLPFHERPLSVAALGAPVNRDIGATLWGDVKPGGLSYYLGLFQGDGRNRPGVDGRGELMARVVWQPLADTGMSISGLRVGASARVASHDGSRVNYSYPAMRTQQGWAFWQPRYTDSSGRRVHVIPADDAGAVAAELWLPVGRLGFRSEVVLVKNQTREAVDGFVSTNTERIGTLRGAGGYLLAQYTVWGKPHIMAPPGRGIRPPKLDFDRPEPLVPEQSVELVLRVEGLAASYDADDRGGAADPEGIDGDIQVASLGLGVNYWATEHARLSANWVGYVFPDSGSADNRARAPGNAAGDPGAHNMHELGVRLGVMF